MSEVQVEPQQQQQQQPAEVVQVPPAQEQAKDVASSGKRSRKLMYAAIIFGFAIALLLGWYFQSRNSAERMAGEKQYAPTFDKSGDTRNPVQKQQPQTQAELLSLAKRAKEAGLGIMGVTQCGWTRRQREMFGDRSSEARKIIESIYIECRTREMCPNIRGYPTWVHGDQQYPGFKDAAKLDTLIGDVAPLPAQPMLHMPAEPQEENTPDEQFAAAAAPNPLAIKAVDQAAAPIAAVAGAASSGPEIVEIVDETAQDPPAPEAAAAEGQKKQTAPASQQEKARGVSDFPPINVPDMPGTAPMALAARNGPSHAGDQMLQGNVPRQSVDNPDAVQEIANQVAQSYQQIASDQQRSATNSLVNRARLPQSSTISTGNAFSDKRLPVKKDA